MLVSARTCSISFSSHGAKRSLGSLPRSRPATPDRESTVASIVGRIHRFQWVGDDQVESLAFELRPGRVEHDLPRLKRTADDGLARPPRLAALGDQIGRRLEFQCERFPGRAAVDLPHFGIARDRPAVWGDSPRPPRP